MTTNIVILAAGPATYEAHDGGYPLCLTEINGTPLLELLIERTRDIESACYVYAFPDKDLEKFHLDQVAKLITPGATVVKVPDSTQGSACTALLATSGLLGDAELLVISANEMVDVDLGKVVKVFRDRNLDGGTLTFKSIHPRYSYVRTDKQGLVVEASQQNPISQTATTGIFWFAKTEDFVNAAKNLIRKNAHVGGRFYIAPAFNELILKQKAVGIYPIPNENYYPLKTERQMQKFEQGFLE